MTTWINSDFDFSGRLRVLILPAHKTMELRDATKKFRDNPELIGHAQ